ncbi:MAG: Stage sporulation protein SpoIIIAA [Dehalococcoidia bacterium]|nr:Stage sporulation protein SpoIIIAA [Dehalococcoidia bacterium]
MQPHIIDDLETLVETLPSHIQVPLRECESLSDLLEVVMDLGRPPEARFPNAEVALNSREVTEEDIQHVVDRIGAFGDDNRAGIERTLHRISAIRNRGGRIVGLTCRVGRAVFGTTRIIEDLVRSGKSILFLGRPGVGKTTMLREVARVLADDVRKRVIIVDTSNEIAGDGDIPHPAIGHSRRMQVVTPTLQHAVMIEAVENHMPEVIIIDEMGTELEAAAARTIAERGVQLVATAHGNTLENLVLNPTLSDLVGGIQTVTLGDDEAWRRRSRKTVLERKSPPPFGVVVEIQSWDRVAVHDDVAKVVDAMLRGSPVVPEVRSADESGRVRKSHEAPPQALKAEYVEREKVAPSLEVPLTRVLPFGVSKDRVAQVVQGTSIPIQVVDGLGQADIVLTTKQFFRKRPKLLKSAEEAGKSIFVLRKNTLPQIREFLMELSREKGWEDPAVRAVREAEAAVEQIRRGQEEVSLSPQAAHIRRLQHQIAQELSLSSVSVGREPNRRVTISRR